MQAVKKTLRREIAQKLKALSPAEIHEQSNLIASNLFALPEFQNAQIINVYLNMATEVVTLAILEQAFTSNKQVFVPKILGKRSEDMKMVRMESMAEVLGLPKDSWGIPDPPLTDGKGTIKEEVLKDDVSIDLILLPGVGFDTTGGRLGHGKGYYDCFLDRLVANCQRTGKSFPKTIGLGLREQMVDQVPTDPHDYMLDVIVTPDETIRPVKQ